MEIGKKIYYDKVTGNVLVDTGERSGSVVETTREQDFEAYKALAERKPESIGLIELEYSEHREDFDACNGYRVDPITGELEFSYPDPNEKPDEPQEPQYIEPLSIQVAAMKSQNTLLKAQLNAQSERSDFIEDVISELATQLYK
ncbi:hypothetical protein [Paenibacillus sp. Marseille-Q9583]